MLKLHLSGKHAQSMDIDSLKELQLAFSRGQKSLRLQVGCPFPTFQVFFTPWQLKEVKGENWKLGKPRASTEACSFAGYSLPKLQNLGLLKESKSKGCHFTPSPPYQLLGPSPAVYCSFGLDRARRSRGCCLHGDPAGSVQARVGSSPKSCSCGHPSSSLSHPQGLPAWVGWLLWKTLLPTAAFHPPCASEKLWVRSAKAAYSTTGLSNGTAGFFTFYPFTSFFGSSVIYFCSNFHCFSKCYFPGQQHQIISLCHRQVICHQMGRRLA